MEARGDNVRDNFSAMVCSLTIDVVKKAKHSVASLKLDPEKPNPRLGVVQEASWV